MDVAAAGVVGSSLADYDQLEEVVMMGGTSSPAASSAVSVAAGSEDEGDLRRGPWTVEEDVLLVNYIAKHGEGRWNSLARSAGLKRTGKSCRLRWLNYLRPDVRRGNITPEEQLLILELHSRWGNRWSKIAQHLPGRTDNEIKNYWRTRVQKHARQLRCDVGSARFRDVVRYVWMPRLVERIQAAGGGGDGGDSVSADPHAGDRDDAAAVATMSAPAACQTSAYSRHHHNSNNMGMDYYYYSESSQQTVAATAAAMSPDDTSSALRSSLTTEASHHHLASTPTNEGGGVTAGPADRDDDVFGGSWSELLLATTGCDSSTIGLPDFNQLGDFVDNLWNLEDLCLHQQCSR